jgi:hypothetical protein
MSAPSTGLSRAERSGVRASNIEPLVVGPKIACVMLDCGIVRLYELLPELETYTDGRMRKITVASIKALIAQRLAAAPQKARAMDKPTGASLAKRAARRVVAKEGAEARPEGAEQDAPSDDGSRPVTETA